MEPGDRIQIFLAGNWVMGYYAKRVGVMMSLVWPDLWNPLTVGNALLRDRESQIKSNPGE